MSANSKEIRKAFFREACLYPPIQALGHSRVLRARPGLLAHSHSFIEICLVLRKPMDWWCGSEKIHINPGTVYITQAGEIHGAANGRRTPGDLYWIQIDLELLKPVELATQLKRAPRMIFGCADFFEMSFKAMMGQIEAAGSLSSMIVEFELKSMLSKLIQRSIQGRHSPSANPPEILKTYLAKLSSNPGEWSSSRLGKDLGMNRLRLYDLFKKELGMSPSDFVTQKKMTAARRRLLQGKEKITEIAHDLGYSSSQHFATVFRNQFGMTPTEMRKRNAHLL